MENWAKDNLNTYIKQGRVQYYKTFDPGFFHHSHAKNLSFKLADADIVCNLNADHFTGEGFAEFINASFHANNDIVITHIPLEYNNVKKNDSPGELWGQVCVKKSDFLAIDGLDEHMVKFGNDDVDFVNRLNLNGVKSKSILKDKHKQFITHDNQERYSSLKIVNQIKSLYIRYIDSCSSELLFLLSTCTLKISPVLIAACRKAQILSPPLKKENTIIPII
jgi:predicted glycosyltransferase involved in capsule biosynthesis